MTAISAPRLKLSDYEARSRYTDKFGADRDALNQIKYGFFGEVGSLLAAVKKAHRDTFAPSERVSALEELGDALWYLTAILRRNALALENVGEAAIAVLERELKSGPADRQPTNSLFDEIDGLLNFQTRQIPEVKDDLLFRMAGQTATLFQGLSSAGDNLASPAKEAQFAELLGALALVAAKFGLGMAEVALANLHKIESRWRPADTPYHSLFDDDYKEHERLPRHFSIAFIERDVRGKKYVVQQKDGVYIGDPLTDNRSVEDDYRFHDVFHLAYVAHLGWSPVIRSLLKLKRKSSPKVDENEDGARAMIIEEGIATWIFNHARDKGQFFDTVEEGRLEYALLKQVQSMVSGYEVDKCPLWQWENAILDGFRVFRLLRQARGGLVTVNMVTHSLEFQAPNGEAK